MHNQFSNKQNLFFSLPGIVCATLLMNIVNVAILLYAGFGAAMGGAGPNFDGGLNFRLFIAPATGMFFYWITLSIFSLFKLANFYKIKSLSDMIKITCLSYFIFGIPVVYLFWDQIERLAFLEILFLFIFFILFTIALIGWVLTKMTENLKIFLFLVTILFFYCFNIIIGSNDDFIIFLVSVLFVFVACDISKLLMKKLKSFKKFETDGE